MGVALSLELADALLEHHAALLLVVKVSRQIGKALALIDELRAAIGRDALELVATRGLGG